MELNSLLLWKHLQYFSAVFLSVFGDITFLNGQQSIRAEPGQNIVLPCRAPGSQTVIVVKWSRTDLGSDYVLRYRDEQLDPDYQHPSFRNRVDLLDGQMKDGDVSLVLKNVTTEDGGSYECRVVQRGAPTIRPISSVVLDVAPSGTEEGSRDDGRVGLALGVSGCIIIIIIIAAVGLVVHRKPGCWRRKYEPPADQPPA